MTRSITDIGTQSLVRLSAAPIVVADDTYVTGAVIDRFGSNLNWPVTALGIVDVGFTTGSGVGGDTQILTTVVEHSANSDMSSPSTIISYAKTFTWVANGANSGTIAVPMSLDGAGRYVRIKAKLTKSGTATITLRYIGHSWVFSGMLTEPSSSYVSTGYANTIEPS